VLCGTFVLIVTMGLSIYAGKIFLTEVDDLAAKSNFQTDSSDITRLANSYIFVNKYLNDEQRVERQVEMSANGIVAIIDNNGSILWSKSHVTDLYIDSIKKDKKIESTRYKNLSVASIPIYVDAEISSLQEYAVSNFSDADTKAGTGESIGHAIVEKPFKSTLGREVRNRYLAIGAIIISSMVILLSIIMYRMIGKPLTTLKRHIAADSIEDIEATIDKAPFSTEEIVSLAGVYISQRKNITLANETLEEQVAVRTKELDELTEKLRALAFRVDHDNQSITSRIAAEIHDDLCSVQIALKRKMEKFLIQNRHSENTDQLTAAIGDWIEMTNQADSIARSIIDRTQTQVTSYLGLAAGIEDAMRHTIKNEENIDAFFINRSERIESLNPVVHDDLVKIVIEAVRNIISHSHATRLTVSIDDDEGLAVVKISDNGDGFDRNNVSRSYGLQTMEQRAVHINGTVGFEQGERGTIVIVKVPYDVPSTIGIS